MVLIITVEKWWLLLSRFVIHYAVKTNIKRTDGKDACLAGNHNLWWFGSISIHCCSHQFNSKFNTVLISSEFAHRKQWHWLPVSKWCVASHYIQITLCLLPSIIISIKLCETKATLWFCRMKVEHIQQEPPPPTQKAHSHRAFLQNRDFSPNKIIIYVCVNRNDKRNGILRALDAKNNISVDKNVIWYDFFINIPMRTYLYKSLE